MAKLGWQSLSSALKEISPLYIATRHLSNTPQTGESEWLHPPANHSPTEFCDKQLGESFLETSHHYSQEWGHPSPSC